MPFDFTTAPKATATDKRRAALAMYHAATYDPALADWRAVADALASVLPALKVAAPAHVQDAAPALEWASYTDAQRRGKGGLFHPSRKAVFRFADGQQITVSLIHRSNLALPDWARAARCAVQFYKAKRARNFLVLIGQTFKPGLRDAGGPAYGNAVESDAESYANSCEVPLILEARDLARDVTADLDRCNAETAVMREGPRYLAELMPYALASCDESGWADWETAWKLATCTAHMAESRNAGTFTHEQLAVAAAINPAIALLHSDRLARPWHYEAEPITAPDPCATDTTPAWVADQATLQALMPLAQRLGGDWVFRLITCTDKEAWKADALAFHDQPLATAA